MKTKEKAKEEMPFYLEDKVIPLPVKLEMPQQTWDEQEIKSMMEKSFSLLGLASPRLR